MLRILLVAPHFAEYALRYASAMTRHAHVHLILDRRNAEMECGVSRIPASTERLKISCYSSDRGWRRIVAIAQIVAHWLTFRPHVIHYHEAAHHGLAMPLFFMRWFACTVMTVHDPEPHSDDDMLTKRLRAQWMQRFRTRRWVHLILAHGEYCTSRLKEQMPSRANNIYSVAMGAHFVPEPGQERVPIPGRLLFFGRMYDYKGLETMIDAADLLDARSVRYSLSIAGRGPDLDRLRPRLSGRSNILVKDRFLSPSDVVGEFQEAAIVVQPYRSATQSAVTVGAFANGRPTVATRVGGLPDVVNDGTNGVLISAGEPQELADAIENLLKDPQRLSELSRAAKLTAGTVMNWDRIADDTFKIYTQSTAVNVPRTAADLASN